jgi:hypothetical protein
MTTTEQQALLQRIADLDAQNRELRIRLDFSCDFLHALKLSPSNLREEFPRDGRHRYLVAFHSKDGLVDYKVYPCSQVRRYPEKYIHRPLVEKVDWNITRDASFANQPAPPRCRHYELRDIETSPISLVQIFHYHEKEDR